MFNSLVNGQGFFFDYHILMLGFSEFTTQGKDRLLPGWVAWVKKPVLEVFVYMLGKEA